MQLSLRDWHNRFTQQAHWTHDLRRYLYDRAGLLNARRVLEVGCGTGALLPELVAQLRAAGYGSVHGFDINFQYLSLASGSAPSSILAQGDAHAIPYASASFDLILCHYFLLWVSDSRRVLSEMRRITRPGGAVLALAEPDYGGRIDYPNELTQLGEWQQIALRRQGADPLIGRRLAGIFNQVGLQNVETGVLGGQWFGPPTSQDWNSEWMVLRADLSGLAPLDKIQKLYEADAAAYERGERVLYVPTFYAWGRVPG